MTKKPKNDSLKSSVSRKPSKSAGPAGVQSSPVRGINGWKIVALCFIIIFVLVIAGGIVRSLLFKPTFSPLTQEQQDAAKAVAVADLVVRGESAEGFAIKVSERAMRPGRQPHKASALARDIPDESADGQMAQVLLSSQSIHHMYIVDLANLSVLVHTTTEFRDGLDHRIDARAKDPVDRPGDAGPLTGHFLDFWRVGSR